MQAWWKQQCEPPSEAARANLTTLLWLRLLTPLVLLPILYYCPQLLFWAIIQSPPADRPPAKLATTAAQRALLDGMLRRHRLPGLRSVRADTNGGLRCEREAGARCEFRTPALGPLVTADSFEFGGAEAVPRDMSCRFADGFVLRYEPGVVWRRWAKLRVSWVSVDAKAHDCELTLRYYSDDGPAWDRDLLAALR